MPQEKLSNEKALQKYIEYVRAVDRLKREFPDYDKSSPGESYAISVLRGYLSKIADMRDEFAGRVDQETLCDAINTASCPLIYKKTRFSCKDLDAIDWASDPTCKYNLKTEMFEFRFKIVNDHTVYISKSEMRLTAALSGYFDRDMNFYRENVRILLLGKLDRKPVHELEFER